MNSSQTLSLRTIASWRIEDIQNESHPQVLATIPALQRGLVWKPSQIELLWDSIFRGFPIGSLVACKHIDDQKKSADEIATHHLLDGQQRSQAISLGFDVADFLNHEDTSHPDILWLDLDPQERIPPNSTRRFLFRLTKRAHPWGYRADDTCSRISARDIRDSLPSTTDDVPLKRPSPSQLKPYYSNLPIPVGLLFQCVTKVRPNEQDIAISFLKVIKDTLEETPIDRRALWITHALEKIASKEWLVTASPAIVKIWSGLQRALAARLTLLEVPSELIGQSPDSSETQDISDIEHLFQRLNTQGTPLSAEELTYSMIKAYYADVSTTVDSIRPLRMKPSRMISIAVRAALSSDDSLHNGYNVSTLRNIARNRKAEFQVITDYLKPDGDLPRDLKLLDKVLIFSSDNPNGLPAATVTTIARSRPETLLLLLIWIRKQPEAVDRIKNHLPGLVSLLAWYGWKHTEQTIHKHTSQDLTLETLRQGLAAALDAHQIPVIKSPAELREKLPVFTDIQNKEEFKDWNAWNHLVQRDSEEETRSLEREWWYSCGRLFTGNLRTSTEAQGLLLYAQRAFLEKRFSGFDQADSELWEDHNRPWDYDHILPHEVSYNKSHANSPFKKSVDFWLNTIGNFWACPFEDNRSYGNQRLSEKAGRAPDDFREKAFIAKAEFEGFAGHYETVKNFVAARKFSEAAKNRMLRIYEEWYTSARIDDLTHSTATPNA
ncbi:MAG: DUF262 domain-containing protein [Akkermansiaceae bacterium]|nr:DUF262 domain-containing protein [Akkermansiaceae bacterium]